MQGGLFVGGGEVVGCYATGTFNQSGGTNCFVGNGDNNTNAYQSTIGELQIGLTYTDGRGHYSYGQGTYNLSGTGLLIGTAPAGQGGNNVGEEFIGYGGTGTFNQTGGTNSCADIFDVGGGGQGFYNLSRGLLSVTYDSESVGNGGTGVFTQTGGTNAIENIVLGTTLTPSSKGTYNLNGGVLQITSITGEGIGRLQLHRRDA